VYIGVQSVSRFSHFFATAPFFRVSKQPLSHTGKGCSFDSIDLRKLSCKPVFIALSFGAVEQMKAGGMRKDVVKGDEDEGRVSGNSTELLNENKKHVKLQFDENAFFA